MSKQLESAAVEHRDEVHQLETRVQELAGELALATETRTRLGMQFEEAMQRTALDADEQLSQLQQELQARFSLIYYFISYYFAFFAS